MNKLIKTIIVGGILMASDIPFNWNNAAALDILNRGKSALDWEKYDEGYRWLNTPTQSGLTNLESGGYDSTWFDIGALPRLFKNMGKELANSKDLYIQQAAYNLGTSVDNPKAQALGSLAYANSSWALANNGGEQPWSHLSQNQQNQIPLFLMNKYENDPNFKAVVDEGDQDKFRAYVSRYLQGVGEDTDLLASPDSIQNSLAPTQGTHAADGHAAEVAKKTYEDFISPGIDKGSEVAAALIANNQRKQQERVQQEGNLTDSWYDRYRRRPLQHKSLEEIDQEDIRKFGRIL